MRRQCALLPLTGFLAVRKIAVESIALRPPRPFSHHRETYVLGGYDPCPRLAINLPIFRRVNHGQRRKIDYNSLYPGHRR